MSFSTFYWITSAINLVYTILNGSVRVICKELNARTIWKYISDYRVSFQFFYTLVINCLHSVTPVGKMRPFIFIVGTEIAASFIICIFCIRHTYVHRTTIRSVFINSKYLIEILQVSYMFLSPTGLQELYRAAVSAKKMDSSSLKVISYGGSPLPRTFIESVKGILPNVILSQAYGLTETAGAVLKFNLADSKQRKLQERKPESCGRPISGISYKVTFIPNTLIIVGIIYT